MKNLQTAATCLDLEEISSKSSEKDYIKFTTWGDEWNDRSGCWSYVGKQGGEQVTDKN